MDPAVLKLTISLALCLPSPLLLSLSPCPCLPLSNFALNTVVSLSHLFKHHKAFYRIHECSFILLVFSSGSIKSRRSSYLLAITTERSMSCDEGLNTFREEGRVFSWVTKSEKTFVTSEELILDQITSSVVIIWGEKEVFKLRLQGHTWPLSVF